MIVDIDEAQLDRDLDVLLAGLPPDAVEGEYIPVEKSWKHVLAKYHVVEGLRAEVAADWRFPEEFDQDATEAIGDLGDRYWPGGVEMADNWGPWAKLLALMGMVAFMNLDKLKAMVMPPPPPEPAKPTPGPAPQPQEEGDDGQPRA